MVRGPKIGEQIKPFMNIEFIFKISITTLLAPEQLDEFFLLESLQKM